MPATPLRFRMEAAHAAVEAALQTGLTVDDANRILFELANSGHLEITVKSGKLVYGFWGKHAA